MSYIHKDFSAHIDTSFINNLYYTPMNVLAQMDKDRLRHSLARAKLACRLLEGILDFIAELEANNSKPEGK